MAGKFFGRVIHTPCFSAYIFEINDVYLFGGVVSPKGYHPVLMQYYLHCPSVPIDFLIVSQSKRRRREPGEHTFQPI
jgi:hypothetical protein